MAHNIVDDGHWFQVNQNAPDFAIDTSSSPFHLIDPANVNLKYADAHPRWIPEIGEPVGESVVLAGLWEVTGSERFLPAQILRIILDALMALLVYRIAMRLFKRRRVALLAAFLYAVYPPIAWQATSPYPDIWGVDFTIAIVALYIEMIYSPHRWRWPLACGVLTGAGAYFRPNVLILPAILALVTIPVTGWRRALQQGLSITLIAALLLVPWTIRNYKDFHTFIPARSGLGETMWQGFGEIHNNFGAVADEKITAAEVHRVRPGLEVQTPAYDAVLKHWAIEAIEHHPLFYAKFVAYNSLLATVWSFDREWMHRKAISPLAYKAGPIAYTVDHPFGLLEAMLQPAVFVLAMLGLGFTWRRWRAQHTILIAVVLAAIVPYILIAIDFRYVLPAAFAYLIWISLGADLLVERVKSWRDTRRTQASTTSVLTTAS
jgi:4-amino-4-deoxy-L-arabinose transferase-like glycosyltransferase